MVVAVLLSVVAEVAMERIAAEVADVDGDDDGQNNHEADRPL